MPRPRPNNSRPNFSLPSLSLGSRFLYGHRIRGGHDAFLPQRGPEGAGRRGSTHRGARRRVGPSGRPPRRDVRRAPVASCTRYQNTINILPTNMPASEMLAARQRIRADRVTANQHPTASVLSSDLASGVCQRNLITAEIDCYFAI